MPVSSPVLSHWLTLRRRCCCDNYSLPPPPLVPFVRPSDRIALRCTHTYNQPAITAEEEGDSLGTHTHTVSASTSTSSHCQRTNKLKRGRILSGRTGCCCSSHLLRTVFVLAVPEAAAANSASMTQSCAHLRSGACSCNFCNCNCSAPLDHTIEHTHTLEIKTLATDTKTLCCSTGDSLLLIPPTLLYRDSAAGQTTATTTTTFSATALSADCAALCAATLCAVQCALSHLVAICSHSLGRPLFLLTAQWLICLSLPTFYCRPSVAECEGRKGDVSKAKQKRLTGLGLASQTLQPRVKIEDGGEKSK